MLRASLFGSRTSGMLGVGHDAAGEHAVGVRRADDLERPARFDLLADGLGQLLAEIAAEAVGLEHRHVDRVDVRRKEPAVPTW